MIEQHKGKMFLAGDRGCCEADWFRTYHTFSCGNYNNAHKVPFGPLQVLNDTTLAGGRSLIQFAETDSELILIPVAGAVEYADSNGAQATRAAGQLQRLLLRKGTTFDITNPYRHELINYIEIRMQVPGVFKKASPQLASFELDKNQNALLQIGPPVTGQSRQYSAVSIGKFDGRKEGVYKTAHSGNGVFVFIVEGAFEVQNRLLEARDGLALWCQPEIEFEALSRNAILLMLEFALPVF